MLLIPTTIFLSAKAYAYDFMVDSMYFNIVSIEEMTCAITYGDSYSNTYVGELVIPEKVTYNGRTLTVTEIDRIEGDSLTSVSIPNSVITIGSYAFSGCERLTSINIPNSVTTIESYAFSGCERLTSINIPNSVTTIESYAFEDCDGLTSVSIPNSVTTIGNLVFAGCTHLEELTIGNGIKELPYDEYINELHQIGSYDTLLGEYTNSYSYPKDDELQVLSTCPLSRLHISDSKEPLKIPFIEMFTNSSSYYGYGYFYKIPLKEVYIGRNLDHNNFFDVNVISAPLDKIEFGGYCTQIGRNCCYSVDTLIIGSNIQSVDVDMIEEQDSLSAIYIKTSTPPQLINNFENKVYLYTKLYVPIGSKSTYQNAEGWKNFWTIEETSDFTGETSISDVQVPRPEVVITSDGITIKESEGAAISVYSIEGKLLYTTTGYKGENIPLRPGIYIIKVNGNSCKVKI